MLPLNNSFLLVEENDVYADRAAERISSLIAAFSGRSCLISLSGGSTPLPVYQRLAKKLANGCDMANLYWIQTDERLVAASSDRSNQRGIRQSLFASGTLPEERFIPVLPELTDENTILSSSTVCQDYFARLQQLPINIRPPAPIDLLILGIGTDGHTASLFPDTDWQTRTTETGFALFKTTAQPESRFSLTLATIMQAREIIFLVNGGAKSSVIEQIFFAPDFLSPASFVARNRAVTWIFDSAAAGSKLVAVLKGRQLLP